MGRLANWFRDSVLGNAVWDAIKTFALPVLFSGGVLTYYWQAVGRHLLGSWPRYVAWLFGFGGLLLALIARTLDKKRARDRSPTLLLKRGTAYWTEGKKNEIPCMHLSADWTLVGAEDSDKKAFEILDAEVWTSWQLYPRLNRPRYGELLVMNPEPIVIGSRRLDFATFHSVVPQCRERGKNLSATVIFTNHRGQKHRIKVVYESRS